VVKIWKVKDKNGENPVIDQLNESGEIFFN